MRGKKLLEIVSEFKINLQQYLETKISYYGVTAFEKAVKLVNMFISNSVVVGFFTIAALFFSGAAALYIGKLLNSYELGLLIVGGAYILLGLISYVFRKKIFGPIIIKCMLKVFFPKEDDD